MRRPTLIAAGLTAAMVAARIFGAAPISDPTGAALPASLHLHFPILNTLLAPLFDTWDGVSMLGMRQLRAFFIWAAVAIVLWRVVRPRRWNARTLLTEAATIIGSVLLLLLFGLVGLAWHRPMASLAGVPAGWMVVDLHTHTNVSHDVHGTLMRGFDAEAARRWHARSGYDAFFITDHNRIDGIPAGGGPPDARPFLCPGEEVSAADQHVVLLGNTALVDNRSYGDSLPGILRLFHDADPRFGAVAIASIPEYDVHHFHDLARFADAGVGGFEVVNGAPKANELTLAHRDSVVALARSRDLALLGVSDSHGWGATAEGWTLIRADSGQTLGRSGAQAVSGFPAACAAILAALRSGYDATQIVARHRLRPDAWWPRWLTPVAVIWEGWRAVGLAQAA
ncbi:MAG TPA: hypothetical protein VFU45_02580, partial [Gemmatimonadales bacterium]|nr:hypothetical protein [Gemmatimonadales bacterium]